jgi:hypothetical protein
MASFMANEDGFLVGREGSILLISRLAQLGTGAVGHSQPLTAAQLETFWDWLGCIPTQRAYEAVRELASVPAQAVPLLNQRLRPVERGDVSRISQWIADLDNTRFVVRKKATEELGRVIELAEPNLRQTLVNRPSLEVRRGIEDLLRRQQEGGLSPERLRGLRAVFVLEQIGNPEARQLLRRLASGAPGSQLTEEAEAALQRLARREP